MTQFWFGFYSVSWRALDIANDLTLCFCVGATSQLGTGQILFESILMSGFNVFFTSLPPLVIGLFEKDVSENVLQRVPGALRSLCLAAQSHRFFECLPARRVSQVQGGQSDVAAPILWLDDRRPVALARCVVLAFICHSLIHSLACMNSVVLCAAFRVRGYRRVGLDG